MWSLDLVDFVTCKNKLNQLLNLVKLLTTSSEINFFFFRNVEITRFGEHAYIYLTRDDIGDEFRAECMAIGCAGNIELKKVEGHCNCGSECEDDRFDPCSFTNAWTFRLDSLNDINELHCIFRVSLSYFKFFSMTDGSCYNYSFTQLSYDFEEEAENERICDIYAEKYIHCSNLFEGFIGMYNDITFVCADEKPVKASRMVLAKFSSVFNEMFAKEINENGEKIDKITTVDINSETMQNFINFLYTGKIGNLGEHTQSFISSVKKYRVRDLCLHNLRLNLSDYNVWATLQIADMYKMPLLFSQCVSYLFQ
jgi:hypothetical protein